MRVTVKGVSKYGFKTKETEEEWLNLDKKFAKREGIEDVREVVKNGEVLELEQNDAGFVTGISKVSGDAPSSGEAPKPSAGGQAGPAKKSDFRSQEQLIRGEAVSAVLGSPVVAELVRQDKSAWGSIAPLIDQMTVYIDTGKFPEVAPSQPQPNAKS